MDFIRWMMFLAFLAPISMQNCEWSCSLDDMCGMVQRDDDDFQWSLGTKTPSPDTGPDEDSARGNFAYIEASEPRKKWDRARLEKSISAAQPGRDRCLTFEWNAFGWHTKKAYLKVYITSQNSIPEKPQWFSTGYNDRQWRKESLDIDSSASSVIFEAVVGDGVKSDLALDNIKLCEAACPGDSTEDESTQDKQPQNPETSEQIPHEDQEPQLPSLDYPVKGPGEEETENREGPLTPPRLPYPPKEPRPEYPDRTPVDPPTPVRPPMIPEESFGSDIQVRLISKGNVIESGATYNKDATARGRVEVKFNGLKDNMWGTVCSDLWSNFKHNAVVICNHVGFRYGKLDMRADDDDMASDTTPILLDGVRCSSHMGILHLSQCCFNEPGVTDCDHSKDVWVTCSNAGDPIEGRKDGDEDDDSDRDKTADADENRDISDEDIHQQEKPDQPKIPPPQGPSPVEGEFTPEWPGHGVPDPNQEPPAPMPAPMPGPMPAPEPGPEPGPVLVPEPAPVQDNCKCGNTPDQCVQRQLYCNINYVDLVQCGLSDQKEQWTLSTDGSTGKYMSLSGSTQEETVASFETVKTIPGDDCERCVRIDYHFYSEDMMSADSSCVLSLTTQDKTQIWSISSTMGNNKKDFSVFNLKHKANREYSLILEGTVQPGGMNRQIRLYNFEIYKWPCEDISNMQIRN